MRHLTKKTIALGIMAALFMSLPGLPAAAQDLEAGDKGSAEAMIGDLVIVRPLGITATALGAVFFVASMPFSLTGNNTEKAFQRFLVEPASYTFARPLGDVGQQ